MDERTVRPKFLTINSKVKWQKMLNANTDMENLTFTSDGSVTLLSKLSPKIETQHKILFKDIIDLSSDSCGLLYLMYENQGKFGIQVLNTLTGYSELYDYEFTNPKSIEASPTTLFVLDENSIKKISRTTHRITDIITVPGVEFTDLCLDNAGVLFVLEKNKHLYKLEEQNPKLVPQNNFSLGKNISNPILGCTVGKENNKFYFLDSNNTFFIYYDSGKYDLSLADPAIGKIIDFDVLDDDNIIVILEDGTTKQFHHVRHGSKDSYGIFDHIIINNNKEFYLFQKSTRDVIQYNFREKYNDQTVCITDALDSYDKQTNWYRIVLGADIPENTSIKISYFASDDKKDMPKNMQWVDILPNDPVDSLIDAKGRYLWLKITLLTLDGQNTPSLQSLTVFFPKFSYMQFLPEVYSTADISNDNILERFLSVFGTVQTDLDEKIFSFTKYLDPGSVPSSFLSWLISWFGMKTDDNWSEEKLRNLLLLLPKYYRMRGTRGGLEVLLSLLLQNDSKFDIHNIADLQPSNNNDDSFFKDGKFLIIESFQLDCARHNQNWNDYERLFLTDPYSFTILINSLTVDNKMIEKINKLIHAEKPAYAMAQISTVDPLFQLGSYVFLGVNTFLNKQILSIGSSMMGQYSLIGEERV